MMSTVTLRDNLTADKVVTTHCTVVRVVVMMMSTVTLRDNLTADKVVTTRCTCSGDDDVNSDTA